MNTHGIKKLAMVLMGAALAACTTGAINEGSGWQAYKSFDQALAAESSPEWERYLSSRINSDLEGAASESDRREIIDQVAYPLWLEEQERHFAKRTDHGVCLTVVGTGRDGGPASVSVQYTIEDGTLKADDFHYQLAELKRELPAQALCPTEFMPPYP